MMMRMMRIQTVCVHVLKVFVGSHEAKRCMLASADTASIIALGIIMQTANQIWVWVLSLSLSLCVLRLI